MYVYDANEILASPLKIISGIHILEAYTIQVEHLTHREYRPRVDLLDDKASAVMATVSENYNIYNYQTVKFPITSSWGKKYILVMYVYDANEILASPLKIISGIHILEAYTIQVEHLTHREYRPRVDLLDDKASASLNK